MKSKTIVTGILAHVDAGKTTLSEALLYRTEAIRKLGRVDKGDTHLDTDEMEKKRGITVYSREARFVYGQGADRRIYTLLDTPGHSDFSPEMERTLPVLDAAILVISASDGVNGRARTLWKLLEHYDLPCLIFVNKMDQVASQEEAEDRRAELLSDMKKYFSDGVLTKEEWQGPDGGENLSLLREDLLEKYMEEGEISQADIQSLFAERLLFPVIFGSALKMEGVDDLLEALNTVTREKNFPEEFGARVYKITRDANGERLTHMRLTGGLLKSRQIVTYTQNEEEVSEKVNQIRILSGDRYDQIEEAQAGDVISVTGLTATSAGQGLGYEEDAEASVLQPVLTWRIRLPMGTDTASAYRKLLILSEEEPSFSVAFDERMKEITVRMMGEMGRELLADMAMRRFKLEIAFERPRVVYKETVARATVGIGHFEPLRHYAEVHLLIEPAERGSGISFETRLSTDVLSGHWQRLILSYLSRKRLVGVLTGSELTDVKISLIAGRAHEKHTEGGDFPQASRRAVRQGLMSTENVLLEPWVSFAINLPQEALGRALSDLSLRHADIAPPEFEGEEALITGEIAVSAMGDYADQVASYTKGEGHMEYHLSSYRPCPDPESVIAEIGYDPEADQRQPSSSVFCQYGAGVVVPWYEVPEKAHLESGYRILKKVAADPDYEPDVVQTSRVTVSRAGAGNDEELTFKEKQRKIFAAEDELKDIFQRTYGTGDSHGLGNEKRVKRVDPVEKVYKKKKTEMTDKASYLLVDGYNIIFAWPELHALAEKDVKAARDRLQDILSNYAGYVKEKVILVFDAYKVAGGTERVETYHNIAVIYTKEAETADQYIEKAANRLIPDYRVAVATSDAVEQVIIFGAGARRVSASDLLEEVERTEAEIREKYLQSPKGSKYFLQNNLEKKLLQFEDPKES